MPACLWKSRRWFGPLAILILLAGWPTSLLAQGQKPAKKAPAVPAEGKPAKPKAPVANVPTPTAANVAYGDHERQVLDFWKAKSDQPTPLLFYIHGGGWVGGSKEKVSSVGLDDYLAAGISVAAINYRMVPAATAAGVKPPVQWPLHDAARALQFVRSKAGQWGLDKTRIGATGGSAGACSSLWLAFHPEMADRKSKDPVARESTRLTCAAVNGAQTTLDPKQMRDWIPNSKYGGHAFGFGGFDKFFDARDQIMPWIKEYSPYEWVSADDPPVLLNYSAAPPAAGEMAKDPTHSATFGVKLEEKLRAVGVECYLVYPGAPQGKYTTVSQFLIDKLKKP